MPMNKFGGVALRFGRNRLEPKFIEFVRGNGRQYGSESEFLEKSCPEGVVLIHVQHPRKTDFSSGRVFHTEWLVPEDAFLLIGKQIRDILPGLLFSKAAFTAVPGDEFSAVAKVIDREDAVVIAVRAAPHGGLKVEGEDLIEGQHDGGGALEVLSGRCKFVGEMVPLFCDERCAEGTHDAGDVGAYDRCSQKVLNGSQNGVVVERAALNATICRPRSLTLVTLMTL